MIKSADLTGHGLSNPPTWPTPAVRAEMRAQLQWALDRAFFRFAYGHPAHPRPLAIDGHAYRRRTRGRRRR